MSPRPDCIFEIYQLWQSGFSRVYSNCFCSCSFEHEIINIGQSSHSNNIVNSQESTTILNACTKKVWKLIEGCILLQDSNNDVKEVCVTIGWTNNCFCVFVENHDDGKSFFGWGLPYTGIIWSIFVAFLQRGRHSPKRCPVNDPKPSYGEASSLPLLPVPHSPWTVAPDRVPSIGEIELFEI